VLRWARKGEASPAVPACVSPVSSLLSEGHRRCGNAGGPVDRLGQVRPGPFRRWASSVGTE
jgi:hypothetical protein